MEGRAAEKTQKQRLSGGLAEWAWKAALRLAMLKEPGVYEVWLIVRADNTRMLVIQNAERPYKLEDLGQ
jgi:hypothetical protein